LRSAAGGLRDRDGSRSGSPSTLAPCCCRSRPPQVDPFQSQKNIEAIQLERRRARTTTVPLPTTAKPEISGDTKPLFKLTAVSVVGAAAIAGDAIAATYRPFIGKTVSKADLSTIAGKISDLYRDAGYHLSRAIVPVQDIEDGRIRIQVIEGRIVDVVLKGEGAEEFGLRPLLAPITAEHPARLETLERQLLLTNDRPGVRITDTALKEIGTASGRFRLIVSLETWHVFQSFGLDSWGTPAVGPLQAYSTSALNSYFMPGDRLGLNLSTVPNQPRELRSGRLYYDTPVGASGARLGGAATYGDVWPGDDRQRFGIHTRAETFDAWASVVPLETRKATLSLIADVAFNDVTERADLGTIYDDHLRILRLAADYQRQDDLGGRNYLTIGLRQGLNVLGASHQGDDFLSRFDGTSLASIFEFAYTRYQTITDTWSLKIAAAGQQADHAPAVAGVLSGRAGVRTRLLRRRGERRQRRRRRAGAALRSDGRARVHQGLSALRLRRPGLGLERRRLRGQDHAFVGRRRRAAPSTGRAGGRRRVRGSAGLSRRGQRKPPAARLLLAVEGLQALPADGAFRLLLKAVVRGDLAAHADMEPHGPRITAL
jgi:hemolysin activation/secretion protein